MTPPPSPPVRVTAENVERVREAVMHAVWGICKCKECRSGNDAHRDYVQATAALAAELEATKRERDEARGAVGGPLYVEWSQQWVDQVCHYRNLSIALGAKPEDMLDGYDRKLCERGIQDDDYAQKNEAREAWADLEAAEAALGEARQDLLAARTNADAWKDSCKEAEAALAVAQDALRALVEHIDLNGGCHRGCDEHYAARRALAVPADTKENHA